MRLRADRVRRLGSTFRRSSARSLLAAAVLVPILGCGYLKLLRPSVLSQLNPRVVALVNELPDVDEPNKEIIARLFAHGGLSHASVGKDDVMRDEIHVPENQLVWEPAIIVMPHGGELELTFHNNDQTTHMALMPTNGGRKLLAQFNKNGYLFVLDRATEKLVHATKFADRVTWGAIDPATGKAAWSFRTKHPMVGSLLTTAGGLVFAGEPTGEFDALDAKTGALLWQFQTGNGIHGSPVAYSVGGKQYVAVPSGWGGRMKGFAPELYGAPRGSALVVFALP